MNTIPIDKKKLVMKELANRKHEKISYTEIMLKHNVSYPTLKRLEKTIKSSRKLDKMYNIPKKLNFMELLNEYVDCYTQMKLLKTKTARCRRKLFSIK